MERAILSGELALSAKLPSEKQLCEEHGLSRASVREVLEGLKSRHLIESRRGSGTFVAAGTGPQALRQSVSAFSALRSSGADFLELMDLRLLLEGECIAELAEPTAKASRAALRRRLEAMECAISDLGAFATADIAFHRELVGSSKHRLFTAILEGLYDGIALRFARATYVESRLPEKILPEHAAICAALEAGDAALARGRLIDHLEESRNHLQQLLSAAEAPDD